MIDASTERESSDRPADDRRGGRPERQRHSVGESIFRGALANFSVQPLTWGASLLTAAVVPRLLGSDALGQLTIAFAITNLAGATLDLGIANYLTRRIAQHPERAQHDLSVALFVEAVACILGAVAIGVIEPRVAPALVDVRILYFALISLVVGAAQGLLLAALSGQEQFARLAWLRALPWIVGPIAGALALFAGGDVVAYLAVVIAIDFGLLVLTWRVSGLRPSRPTLDLTFLHETRELVRGGFPFLSWTLTLSLYGGIDKLLLGFFVPVSEVGYYAAAYRIISIPVFVPTLLITPLLPVLSRSVHDPITLRRTITQALKLILLITAPLSAGIIVLAPAVPGLLGWPADFDKAIPLMIILSLHLPVVGLDMVLGAVIMATGRVRLLVRVGLIAAVLNVAGNLVAIPLFEHVANNGPIGASIVTVLTELWMFVGALILIPKHLLDSRTLWQAPRIVLAGAGGALVATALLPSIVLAAVGGGLTYLMLAVTLRVVSREDVAYVRHRFTTRRARTQPS